MLTRHLLPVVTAVALTIGIGGFALAATRAPAASGNVVSACYNTKTGALSVITPKHKRCGSGEKAISWNKTGPAGSGGTAYSTQGTFADSLGSAATVADLSLPGGSFTYSVSVNFANSTSSADTVTCAIADGGGKKIDMASSTVAASADQTISFGGASTAPAGDAKVACQDTANSASAVVNGAVFTATQVASVPTSGAVLRTSSLTGPAVAAGDTLSTSLIPPECASGAAKATVSANPQNPGTATLSITTWTFGGCSIMVNGSPVPVTVAVNDLPYSLTIADTGGNLVTSGAVNFTVTVPSLSTSCTYTAPQVTGHWNNAINGIALDPGEELTTKNICTAPFPLTGSLAQIEDTTASGSPLVFVS
jgi:hypothetical protein